MNILRKLVKIMREAQYDREAHHEEISELFDRTNRIQREIDRLWHAKLDQTDRDNPPEGLQKGRCLSTSTDNLAKTCGECVVWNVIYSRCPEAVERAEKEGKLPCHWNPACELFTPKVVTKGNENVDIDDGEAYRPESLTKTPEDLMATEMPITKENLPYGNTSYVPFVVRS